MLLTILALTLCFVALVGIVALCAEAIDALIIWWKRRKDRKRAARDALFNPIDSSDELIKPPIIAID